MNTDYIKIYLEQNKTLIQTMSVKMHSTIDGINENVKFMHGEGSVNENNPATWKYYLNVAGIYHFTDVPMEIVSLDTLEKIIFTRESLEVHRKTKEGYKFGSTYYKALVKQYPEQEQLILGILYPCDIDKAIAAEEGSILSYPEELVEPQEATLIMEFDEWFKKYVSRWHVRAFSMTDSLYNTAQQAIMFLNAYPKLLNLRLARCKTLEAHSFHIRQYLGSHNELDKYLPYLTLKQALWLYRNILYVERNSGKTDNFRELIDILLTERNIPISEYTVRQVSSLNDELYTETVVRRKPVNTKVNLSEIDYLSLDEMYAKETYSAYGNASFYKASARSVTHKFLTIDSSVKQTKDLESSVVDYTDAVPDTLEEVLLRQWCYMAYHDRYTAVITFKNPRTSELHSLSAKDAFIYLLYVKLNQANIEIDTLPKFLNDRFRLDPLPSEEDLLNLVDRYNWFNAEQEAKYLLRQQPVIEDCVSTPIFFEQCYQIYQECLRQWYYLSNVHDINESGYVWKMMDRLYGTEFCDFDDGSDIVDWLVARELPVYNLSNTEADELIQNIFQAGTGINDDSTQLLKNIQKAMLSIMKQLSSYSVQFLSEINNSNIVPLNWKTLRFGSSSGAGGSETSLPININFWSDAAKMEGESDVEVDLIGLNEDELVTMKSDSFVDVGFEFTTEGDRVDKQTLMMSQLYFDIDYEGKDKNLINDHGFTGYENYLRLTDEEKMKLKSVY